jgi:hypothetical protein
MKNQLTTLKPFHRLWESLLQHSVSLDSLSSDLAVKKKMLSLWSRVSLALKTGQTASRSLCLNSRFLVGSMFLIMAVGSIFLYLLFDENADDRSWYYTGWFFFFRTLRMWMVLTFAPLAILYYVPSKSKIVYIVATVFTSCGILGIIHYSFFVHDYYSFHSFPVWSMWVLALSFGMGFVLAADHLVYVFEHKIKGNHKRFVMLEEHRDKIDAATRQRMLQDNLNEYRRIYTHY